MDDLLLRRCLATPIRSQHCSTAHCRSIAFVVIAGRRKRRKSNSLSVVTKALTLAVSFAHSLQRLLPSDGISLDNFLLPGRGYDGGSPSIWTSGFGGRWWRRPGSRRRRWNATDAMLMILAFGSAVVLMGRISLERDIVIRVLVPVILGLRIQYWKQWFGFPVLWTTLHIFALLRRTSNK